MNPILEQYNAAYEKAQQLDSLIYELMKKRPIETDCYYWIKLCRTITTTLQLINELAEKQTRTLWDSVKRQEPLLTNLTCRKGHPVKDEGEGHYSCPTCGESV